MKVIDTSEFEHEKQALTVNAIKTTTKIEREHILLKKIYIFQVQVDWFKISSTLTIAPSGSNSYTVYNFTCSYFRRMILFCRRDSVH